MHRRSMLVVGILLVALALPLSASQFVKLPFDQVARESAYIVRGNVEQTWSAWDDAHEVIYTYATVRVSRYFGDSTGPDTIVVRPVPSLATVIRSQWPSRPSPSARRRRKTIERPSGE